MNIEIYINTKKPTMNMKAAIDEYTKRLSAYCRIRIYYLPMTERKLNETIHTLLGQEHSACFRITKEASNLSSEELSDNLNTMGIQGISHICYLIGYPAADSPVEALSLSQITMSDMLTGVVLCEQLYRCYRIIHNQPYHK